MMRNLFETLSVAMYSREGEKSGEKCRRMIEHTHGIRQDRKQDDILSNDVSITRFPTVSSTQPSTSRGYS